MAKNKRPAARPAARQIAAGKPETDSGASLKELLSADTLQRLKAQADELKAEDRQRREEERQRAEEARKAEQKRLENDFAHLLETSDPDWKKYKR
ncbi:hypothetical protein J31TS4_27120 [Paenibacillus sp. J31TS4]|uniref:YqkE family protein n=1 Tax=Paenibacillus sp. J31TS4 TaxID=2807195 RepID=UPI001B0AB40C|nr:YqkE family protein [Paenibacillus sp. J31TS4]GIP39432.1 hypothetical protein J31TS4_27120 [Paenibacillus sp. J31TS4]